MNRPILIADDDYSILSALQLQLKSEGFSSKSVTSPHAALELIKKADFSLVLMDLNYSQDTTSGREGLKLIQAIREVDTDIPIVVMTGWSSVSIAVESMRNGANDFIEKPCDNNRLMTIIRNSLTLSTAKRQSTRLATENQLLKDAKQPLEWIAQSQSMQQVMQMVRQIAVSDINVLITGENGTGKSQLAQIIHDGSLRQSHSLVAVNMGAINESVFESELFGHVKGAFTDAKADRIGRFELADNGTLFLDEIANIPLSQQAKLLRVLENGEFERLGSSKVTKANVRVISATNGNLNALVEQRKFRQDLLFRLNSIEIKMPPLRERIEDIQPLSDYCLRKYSTKYRRNVVAFTHNALTRMLEYAWPGNVRELDHLIERAVLMAPDTHIDTDHLLLDSSQAAQLSPDENDWSDMTMEQAEQKLIRLVMRKYHGNAKEAAKSLGYSKSAFYRRLEKFNL
jgi:DNA-binding NtrC family response regulator